MKDIIAKFRDVLPINDEQFSVNARDLHKTLEVTQRFNDWINVRLSDADSEQGIGHYLKSSNVSDDDYHPKKKRIMLTLSLAKEIAMLERSDIGKLIRKYFIACEEKINHLVKSPKTKLELMKGMVDTLIEHEQAINQVNERLDNTPVSIDGKKEGHLHGLLSSYGKKVGNYSVGYTKFYKHYGIGSYKQLPLRLYDEAVVLVTQWHKDLDDQQGNLFN